MTASTLSKNWLRWKAKRLEYPENWKQISEEVRRRAGYRCQFCSARHNWFHPITGSIVYLQAAHLDHNIKNCSFDNLSALCQRCHLIYDARLHVVMSIASKRKPLAIGDLFDGQEDRLLIREKAALAPLQSEMQRVLEQKNAEAQSRLLFKGSKMRLRQQRLVD